MFFFFPTPVGIHAEAGNHDVLSSSFSGQHIAIYLMFLLVFQALPENTCRFPCSGDSQTSFLFPGLGMVLLCLAELLPFSQDFSALTCPHPHPLP